MNALGAGLGLVAAVGLWLIVRGLPVGRRNTLDARVAPYLGVHLPSHRPRGAFASAAAVLEPLSGRLERAVARFGSDPVSVRARLVTAGAELDLQQFRAQQVLGGLLGLAAGGLALLVLAAGAATGQRVSPAVGPLTGALLVVVCGAAGVLGRDQLLSRQAHRRVSAILAEFPTVAELLALSVGAGEGAVGALDRVARTCTGALPDELRVVLGETRTGLPVAEALQRMSVRIGDPSLSAFVDGVVVALERGTPLADVLRAQAQDVRVQSRRRLMESGGRREILMMVPVVFMILPITVVFAVYPGLAVLDLRF